jgi:cobyrinic acid a,c-diamide synthase
MWRIDGDPQGVEPRLSRPKTSSRLSELATHGQARMSILTRLAIGAIQPEADCRPICWGLLDALEQSGVRAQLFLSRACFAAHDAATTINGHTPRHLDSWLMTRDSCRHAFWRATADVDAAVVEGRYDAVLANPTGGSLDTLCDWLDLTRLAVIDCSRINDCHLPARPLADGLLLDCGDGACDLYRWQTIFESLWKIPVVGAIQQSDGVRRAIADLTPGQKPSLELCNELGREFLRHTDINRLLHFASRQLLPTNWKLPEQAPASSPRTPLRVAVAYDDAFSCYFPDTLDMLELRGATVRVFSPLRDEHLPPGTDIVYLGCGRPQDHAAALADNHCLMMALKEHICAGRRVYAEGGGLAYLCQHVEMPDGTRIPMIGALRAIARRNPVRVVPEPIELSLDRDCWLGSAGSAIRGYLNANWVLEPTGCLRKLAGKNDQLDIVGHHQVIGSRVHLNFAAQPALLGGFFQPCPPALAWTAAG